MNAVKSIGIMVLLLGGIAVSATVSFAKNDHSQEEIKVLNDSALALEKSDPVLAARLLKYAAEEEKEAGQMENENDKSVDNEEAGVKLLLEGAEALKGTNRELSNNLAFYAEREKQEIAEMKMK
ncbi:MAG: hypothetical protein PHS37_05955 [Candidatus Omnitrophica bacterium]|nr:hypothetical protein [Candidatus Omnitrophota bacterium]